MVCSILGKKVFKTLCVWGRELQVNFEDEQLLPTYTNRMQLGAITQGTMYMRVCVTEVQVNLKNDLLLPKGNYTLTNCDLLNFILTQCCWIPRKLPLSHWLVAWCCWTIAGVMLLMLHR